MQLLDLTQFKSHDEYLEKFGGKNSAAYYTRKSAKAGFRVREFDPDSRGNEILEINSSAPLRQGRKMDEDYLKQKSSYRLDGNFLYLGVFDKSDVLVAYLFIQIAGEVGIVVKTLAHEKYLKDNVMYLLFTEAIRVLSGKTRYFMYDMYFGGSDGLRLFKTRIGFSPHRVKWKLPNG